MPGIAFKSAPEMNAANVNAPASAAMPLRITFTIPQTILPATIAVKRLPYSVPTVCFLNTLRYMIPLTSPYVSSSNAIAMAT